jgi:hypothetical protein
MRLYFPLFRLSHIAQAIASGRCPFYEAIVPLCFSPRFVVPNLFGVWIVFNCSDHPFFNKTPKNMPKIGKTIETILLRLLADPLKKQGKFGNNTRPTKPTQALCQAHIVPAPLR